MMQTASITRRTPSGGRWRARTSTTSVLFSDFRLVRAASCQKTRQQLMWMKNISHRLNMLTRHRKKAAHFLPNPIFLEMKFSTDSFYDGPICQVSWKSTTIITMNVRWPFFEISSAYQSPLFSKIKGHQPLPNYQTSRKSITIKCSTSSHYFFPSQTECTQLILKRFIQDTQRSKGLYYW
jgi:hypothetical protein